MSPIFELLGGDFAVIYVKVDLAGKVGTLNLSDEVSMMAVPARG